MKEGPCSRVHDVEVSRIGSNVIWPLYGSPNSCDMHQVAAGPTLEVPTKGEGLCEKMWLITLGARSPS